MKFSKVSLWSVYDSSFGTQYIFAKTAAEAAAKVAEHNAEETLRFTEDSDGDIIPEPITKVELIAEAQQCLV